MAGFYIHIPFCAKACYYCDFHFVASLKHKGIMLESFSLEMEKWQHEWSDVEFSTLYFGGGTPSVLDVYEISAIIDKAKSLFNFKDDIELTLEANPDDLTEAYLRELKQQTEINRFSIGTQSFHDSDLTLLNRRHNGEDAYRSITNAYNLGFTNLNIDLIYGIPGLSIEDWEYNLDRFIELGIPHLSAYHLSIEPKTVFDNMRRKGKIIPVDEEASQAQYQLLIDKLKKAGYIHYEVSNFAKEGFFSKHNTNYWLVDSYLGIGPSAHSFKNKSRRWNIANNTRYCDALKKSTDDFFTKENLSMKDAFNEYVLTALRQLWGINLSMVEQRFGKTFLHHVEKTLKRFSPGTHYVKTDNGFALRESAWLISDYIIREFMI